MFRRLNCRRKALSTKKREHRPHWDAKISASKDLHAAPTDVLSGLLLEDAALYNAVKKVVNPPDKQLFQGIVAGIWVGLAGLAATSAAGGIPDDVRARWIFLPKFLLGAFFAFAFHMIVIFGGDLFTGNIMTHAIGFYNKVVPLRSIILNLLIVYIGNWAGTLFVAYFFGYLTHLFNHGQQISFLHEIVQSKLEQASWGQIFLKGIAANTMVCMAYMLGLACRGAAGKMFALWFPIVMFVLCGFEHSVANMFFNSLGLMYGAHSTIGRLWYNQSAAALGNIVGGAIFIGLAAHGMNHWNSPIFISDDGTLLGHDVESTRRAKEVDAGQLGAAHPHVQDSTSVRPSHTTAFGDENYPTSEAPDYGTDELGVPTDHVRQDRIDPPTLAFASTHGNNLHGNQPSHAESRSRHLEPSFSERWRMRNGTTESDPEKMV